MGWLYMQSLDGHKTPKAYLDNQLTFERETGSKSRVLKSSVVKFRTYYAAVEIEREGTREVVAVVCMINYNTRDKEGYIFGYKDMDETMGPYQTECPTSILDLLTPTTSEYAVQWRANCRSYQTRRASATKLKEGDTITFEKPITFTSGAVISTFRAVRPRRGKQLVFAADGQWSYFRIRNWQNIPHTVTKVASAR